MEILSALLALSFFLFVLAAVIGLVRPTAVWQTTRLRALGLYLGAALLMLLGLGFMNPEPEQESTGAKLAPESAEERTEAKPVQPLRPQAKSSPQHAVKVAYQHQPAKNKDLVSNFCYAQQASILCDDLVMRPDTEAKIEAEAGGAFNSPNTPYVGACMAGLSRAIQENSKKLCQRAWDQYGCFGNKGPKLLQKSLLSNQHGVVCPYESTQTDSIGIAHPYTIVDQSIEMRHAINRKKVRAYIKVPGAITPEDRAATLIQAARDVQRNTDGTSVSVVLWDEALDHHGYPFQLGWADYIPDGRGISGQDAPGKKWDVQVADVQLTERDIRIMAAWFEYRDQFKDQFGRTDEDRLISHLANILNLSEDEIKLPSGRLRKVSYKG